MTVQHSLMTFPCHFPIKIIGKKTPHFLEEISTIVRTHFPDTRDEAIEEQDSQRSNYSSITATIYASDQATLDKLYYELTKHPDIKMVL